MPNTFIYKYIIRWSDLDQFQHMSFANYLKLMFSVVDNLIHASLDTSQYRLHHLEASMNFQKQTVLGDKVIVKTQSEIIGMIIKLYFQFELEASSEKVGYGVQLYEIRDTNTKQLVLPKNIVQILDKITKQCEVITK
jgi:acyl-CoA thioesterase FadM